VAPTGPPWHVPQPYRHAVLHPSSLAVNQSSGVQFWLRPLYQGSSQTPIGPEHSATDAAHSSVTLIVSSEQENTVTVEICLLASLAHAFRSHSVVLLSFILFQLTATLMLHPMRARFEARMALGITVVACGELHQAREPSVMQLTGDTGYVPLWCLYTVLFCMSSCATSVIGDIVNILNTILGKVKDPLQALMSVCTTPVAKVSVLGLACIVPVPLAAFVIGTRLLFSPLEDPSPAAARNTALLHAVSLGLTVPALPGSHSLSTQIYVLPRLAHVALLGRGADRHSWIWGCASVYALLDGMHLVSTVLDASWGAAVAFVALDAGTAIGKFIENPGLYCHKRWHKET